MNLSIFSKVQKPSPTILIYADMEGIAGVTKWEEVIPGRLSYIGFQQQMTDEVNAAIAGAFAAGAGRVLVNDLHWYYNNLLWDQLDSRAEPYRGENLVLDVFSKENIDGVFIIGLHAMACTPNAILPHSWALPDHLAALRVNCSKIGEIGMITYAAAMHDVPVVLLTGDEVCFSEMDELTRSCEKVSVKKIKKDKPVLVSEQKVIKKIQKAAKRAVRRIQKQKVSVPDIFDPFEFRLTFPDVKMAQKAHRLKYEHLKKDNEIIFVTHSFQEGMKVFFDAVALTFE